MKKKRIFKGISDGIFQSVILELTIAIFCSSFGEAISDIRFFLVFLLSPLVSAMISALIYFLFVKRETNSNLSLISAISAFSFVIVSFILLVTNPFRLLFPVRELGNGDGLMMLFMMIIFVASAVILKLCVFIGALIKNKRTNKKS